MKYSDFATTPFLQLALADEDSVSLEDEVAAWVGGSLLPLVPVDAKLVSIDGLDGVGKSTLGKALADCSGSKLIHLDSFLKQDQNCYLGALDLAAFRESVLKSSRVIAEGCLIQAALANVGLSSDFRIYVTRITKMLAHPDVEWIDERDLLFGDKSAEECIAEEEELMRRWEVFSRDTDTTPDPYEVRGLRRELIRYHVDMSPHLQANLILKLVRWT